MGQRSEPHKAFTSLGKVKSVLLRTCICSVSGQASSATCFHASHTNSAARTLATPSAPVTFIVRQLPARVHGVGATNAAHRNRRHSYQSQAVPPSNPASRTEGIEHGRVLAGPQWWRGSILTQATYALHFGPGVQMTALHADPVCTE